MDYNLNNRRIEYERKILDNFRYKNPEERRYGVKKSRIFNGVGYERYGAWRLGL